MAEKAKLKWRGGLVYAMAAIWLFFMGQLLYRKFQLDSGMIGALAHPWGRPPAPLMDVIPLAVWIVGADWVFNPGILINLVILYLVCTRKTVPVWLFALAAGLSLWGLFVGHFILDRSAGS